MNLEVSNTTIENQVKEILNYETDKETIKDLKALNQSDFDEIAYLINEKMEIGMDLDTAIEDNIFDYIEDKNILEIEKAKGYLEGTLDIRITDKQVQNIISYFKEIE